MWRTIILEVLTATMFLGVVILVGDGCAIQAPPDPCSLPGPPPGCGDPPPFPENEEEMSPEDGTEGITGAGSLDTFTGNTVFTVVVGTGTPPGQLCSASFQACVNLANGITGNEILDLEVLPFDAEQPSPVIADLAIITPNSLSFVNMTTRVATPSGITFTGPLTDLEISPNGDKLYIAATNTVSVIDIATRRSERTITFPTTFRVTSVAGTSFENPLDLLACGSDSCYHARGDGAPILADGVRGGHVSFGVERMYVANPTQGIVVLDALTGSLVTTYALPNATQCAMHVNGECITCVAPSGNNTLVVEFDTLKDTEVKRITLPGTNTFIESNLTSRALAIGQQATGNTGAVIYSCNLDLECVDRGPQPRNRRAAFVPVNQPR